MGESFWQNSLVPICLPTVSGWAGWERVAPMFALYQSVPKKGALQLGTEMSSVPSDGNRTLCIDGNCCISLRTLLRIN